MADCNAFLSKVFELEKNNQMTPMAVQIREKVYLRTLICYASKGEFGHFEDLAEMLISEKFLKDEQKELVKKDLEKIVKRREILTKKEEADSYLKQGLYDQAEVGYLEIIDRNSEEEENERILSNLSLCALKLNKIDTCIQYCSRVIDRIRKAFDANLYQYNKAKHNEHFKALLIKSYYRKAQGLFQKEMIKECEENLREILLIDERNEEARSMKRNIEKKRNLEEAQRAKREADNFLKEGNHTSALEQYSQALFKFDPSEQSIEYASVLLNMTVCHTALEQVDEVISDCIKGLRVTAKHSKALIKFEKTKLTPEDQEKLKQLELRFYMRKGNAFLKKGQIYHAKADFEEAIKLAPENKEIKQSLDKIAML